MLVPRKQDVIHKSWLLRLLTAICENPYLAESLGFKGGTCAAMRGLINRFSIDLDFDLLVSEKEIPKARKHLEKIFTELGLEIKDQSSKVPQYFLRYPVGDKVYRNTIKLDVFFPAPPMNDYEMVHLPEIDRIVKCQTLDTMVAHKLITLIARHERTSKIAARDIFDVYQFLLNGYPYKKEIIESVRKVNPAKFFHDLIELVDKKVNTTIINQDLNSLLPSKEFHGIRKILKQQTLILLRDELERINKTFPN